MHEHPPLASSKAKSNSPHNYLLVLLLGYLLAGSILIFSFSWPYLKPFFSLSNLPYNKKKISKFHTIFKMSNTLLFMPFLCLLLLLSPHVFAIRTLPIFKVAVATRPLGSKAQEYVTLKPKFLSPGQHGPQNGNVEGCLPKGFRRSSAPSRYVNYHVLGSTVCSTGKHMNQPWTTRLRHYWDMNELIKSSVLSIYKFKYWRVVLWDCGLQWMVNGEWRCKPSIVIWQCVFLSFYFLYLWLNDIQL